MDSEPGTTEAPAVSGAVPQGSGSSGNIPNGKSTVTPYVVVKDAGRFLDFVRRTFGATETVRVPNEDGTIGHAEVVIGNSVVMAFDAKPGWPDTPSFLSVYVDDVDAVVGRALESGGTVVTAVTTSRIVGDRGGRIKDPAGNIWWVQTHLEDVDGETMRKRFQDPGEVAVMQRLQQSFDDEMSRRR
jgi:PhnB protein